MLQPTNWSRQLLHCACRAPAGRTISTNTAINRGLRDTRAAERSSRSDRFRPLFPKERAPYDKKTARLPKDGEFYQNGQSSPISIEEVVEEGVSEEEQEEKTKEKKKREVDFSKPPPRLPYTTAASQFLFGASAAHAAIKAGRRRLYKLYLHERVLNREEKKTKGPRKSWPDSSSESLLTLAAKVDSLQVIKVGDEWLPTLDQMSGGRPHNGCVLEASPLPVLPSIGLRAVSRARPYFLLDLDKQSAEDRLINGAENRLSFNSHGWRYPFILYLDGIVDTGNIGAIIRSAFYLGVDAIAISQRATAPIDSVAVKASSGAAEAMPIITVKNPLPFLTASALNGWRIYAADAPPLPDQSFSVTSDYHWRALDPRNTSPLITFSRPNSGAVLHGHSPLAVQPSILMLGGEGSGFRHSVRSKANYLVGIRGVKGPELGVDSLNVSVAAALIMLEFLKKPPKEVALKKASEAEAKDNLTVGEGLLF